MRAVEQRRHRRGALVRRHLLGEEPGRRVGERGAEARHLLIARVGVDGDAIVVLDRRTRLAHAIIEVVMLDGTEEEGLVDLMHTADIGHVYPRVAWDGNHPDLVVGRINMNQHHYLREQRGVIVFPVVVADRKLRLRIGGAAQSLQRPGGDLEYRRRARPAALQLELDRSQRAIEDGAARGVDYLPAQLIRACAPEMDIAHVHQTACIRPYCQALLADVKSSVQPNR